jgi:hypothetical protein
MEESLRAEIARRVAVGLASLESGRVADARRQLLETLDLLRSGGVVDVTPPAEDEDRLPPQPEPEEAPLELAEPAHFEERELELAFESAAPERDAIVDADQIAHEAMREADLDAPEGVSASMGMPFATRTVADLLERQGHADEANRLRARIDLHEDVEPAPAAVEDHGFRLATGVSPHRARVLATLERWLENLRKGVA